MSRTRQTLASAGASKSLATKSIRFLDGSGPMPRYLTFDQKTASTLREQLPGQQVFEHGAPDAVDYALSSEKTLVTVIPTGAAREAAVAVFRRRKAQMPAEPAQKPAPLVEMRKPVASVPLPQKNSAIRAGGFLGLRDEVVFEQEEPPIKKRQSWWRHFWPEDE